MQIENVLYFNTLLQNIKNNKLFPKYDLKLVK